MSSPHKKSSLFVSYKRGARDIYIMKVILWNEEESSIVSSELPNVIKRAEVQVNPKAGVSKQY